MSFPGLLVACVIVFASVDVDVKGSLTDGVVSSSSPKRTNRETFFIYPRTGRLFHADFVRDNEIYRSLEKTNFMRRGPFSGHRSKRDVEDISEKKKYVYDSSGRIPVLGVKKEVLPGAKDTTLKVNDAIPKYIARSKRDVNEIGQKFYESQPLPTLRNNNDKVASQMKTIDQEDTDKTRKNASKKNYLNNETLNLQGTTTDLNSNPTSKNSSDEATKLKEIENRMTYLGDSKVDIWLKKTVLDDGLKLYPIYKGVTYSYPGYQRRLLFSPSMTVQMDTAAVTDDNSPSLASDNSTSRSLSQGRGKRRRSLIKKLAVPLLLALKLKTAIMLPLIIGLISLISFKGLWSGLTALGIAAALGLKALVGGSKVIVHPLPPPPPPHFHHFPPHEYTEYWSRRDDFSDYRPNTWS